ncbi:MAG: hypothetical protein RLZZ136_882 [Pseudomonadota bacterium]
MPTPRLILLAFSSLSVASPVLAHPGGWGDGAFDRQPTSMGHSWERDRSPGPVEGKIEVNRFIGDQTDPATLGSGTLAVSAAPAGNNAEERELRTYESAVADRLAASGYQTATTLEAAAQIAEVRVTHDTVVPEEQPHKPVSGTMSMGVSNRGSMLGLGIAIDMTKPAKALISTRLEARIRDRASGTLLWEGRADVVTREGSAKWDDNTIAARLARALFDGFPGHSGETRVIKP